MGSFASLFHRRASVGGVIALAQLHDNVPDLVAPGLLPWPRPLHHEEIGQFTTTEIVTEHPERMRRIAEPPRGLCRRKPFDEIGSQSFVLPLAWCGWPLKKATTFRQVHWKYVRSFGALIGMSTRCQSMTLMSIIVFVIYTCMQEITN